jgi:hypothetical protein
LAVTSKIKKDKVSASKLAPDKVRTPKGDGPAEAARLRAEGHSLRAIGAKLGVDQKQVQRWLKAVQGQAVPGRVVGLDGKSYRGSAAKPKFNGRAVSQLNEVLDRRNELGIVRRAYAASYRAGRKAAKSGEPYSTILDAMATAWRAVLSESDLLDTEDEECAADACFGEIVQGLATCMTTRSLKELQEEIVRELDRRHYDGPLNEWDRLHYGYYGPMNDRDHSYAGTKQGADATHDRTPAGTTSSADAAQ